MQAEYLQCAMSGKRHVAHTIVVPQKHYMHSKTAKHHAIKPFDIRRYPCPWIGPWPKMVCMALLTEQGPHWGVKAQLSTSSRCISLCAIGNGCFLEPFSCILMSMDMPLQDVESQPTLADYHDRPVLHPIVYACFVGHDMN